MPDTQSRPTSELPIRVGSGWGPNGASGGRIWLASDCGWPDRCSLKPTLFTDGHLTAGPTAADVIISIVVIYSFRCEINGPDGGTLTRGEFKSGPERCRLARQRPVNGASALEARADPGGPRASGRRRRRRRRRSVTLGLAERKISLKVLRPRDVKRPLD